MMTHLVDITDLLSLIRPLLLCAAAWGIVVWALRQRDQVSEAVDGLLSAHHSTDPACQSDTHLEARSIDNNRRPRWIGW